MSITLALILSLFLITTLMGFLMYKIKVSQIQFQAEALRRILDMESTIDTALTRKSSLPVAVSSLYNADKNQYLLDIENHGDLSVFITKITFLDKNLKKVGSLKKDFPHVKPRSTINFALTSKEYEDYDHLTCILSLTDKGTSEDILIVVKNSEKRS